MRKKAVVFTIIAVLILGGGLIAANGFEAGGGDFKAERQRRCQLKLPETCRRPIRSRGKTSRVSPVTLAPEQLGVPSFTLLARL